jgi:hypothetical protein
MVIACSPARPPGSAGHLGGEGGLGVRRRAGQAALRPVHQEPYRRAPHRVRQGRALEDVDGGGERAHADTALGGRGRNGLTRAW